MTKNIFICQPHTWQILTEGQDEIAGGWLPSRMSGTWFFTNCIAEHWVLVAYSCSTRVLTQYDTLGDGKDTSIADRIQ